MVTQRADDDRNLYARWDIRAFRGVVRFSDYKRAKARIRRSPDTRASINSQRPWRQRWRSLRSDKGMTTIIAIGTVALVLLAVATLIVMLLLRASAAASAWAMAAESESPLD